MDAGVSRVYAEEGELWLRVSPGHAVSEHWLQQRAPELYAQWWAAPSAAQRDRLALEIERRLEELEALPTRRQGTTRVAEQAGRTVLDERIARYEASAERLGALPLDHPARLTAHLAHQAEGDSLRDLLATTMPMGPQRDLMARRLDAADLVADRPVIEAVSGMSVEVD